jgi:uncharacterized protein (TIGR03067 family)
LIQQLGHDQFTKREQASKELFAIGEPALAPLRTAAAATNDAEVRSRAERVIDAIMRPIRAAAAKKELAKWQGVWTGNGGQKFIFQGDRWAWGEAGLSRLDDTHKNRIEIIEAQEKAIHADLIVIDPQGKKVCRAIFRLDGDTLHYCGTYESSRPTEFRSTPNAVYVAWKRVTKGGSGKN